MTRALAVCVLLGCGCGERPGSNLEGAWGDIELLDPVEVDDPRAAFDPREAQPGGTATGTVRSLEALRGALNVAGNRWRSDFVLGEALFDVAWQPAPGPMAQRDGLGPLFHAASCAECHPGNARGAVEDGDFAAAPLLLRISLEGQPVPGFGSQLQPKAIAGVDAEGAIALSIEMEGTLRVLRPMVLASLPAGTQLSLRMSPGLQGLGLLEAVPLAQLEALADPDDRDGDGISGKVARLDDGTVGRFGWKALHSSVRTQAAGALHEDLGLTTTLHPEETCTEAQLACQQAPTGGRPEVPEAVLAPLVTHVRLLTVLPRVEAESFSAGKRLFFRLGCEGCHRASLNTADDVQPPALGAQTIWPYSDLLLHDLGDELADGRPEGAASGREWRTAPLWSLAVSRQRGEEGLRLLHDGRARTFSEAIEWHGGEAEQARARWRRLDQAQRDELLRFLESL